MTRVLDANDLVSGSEPKHHGELNKIQFINALNWYNSNKIPKDAHKYAFDFLKKKHKIDASDVLKDEIPTFGFVCRMISNGVVLSESNQKWFDDKISKIKIKLSESKVKITVEDTSPAPTIQERIAEKVAIIGGELEGLLDDYISSDFKINPSPYSILHTKGAKGTYTNKIIDIWKKHRAEYDEALNSDDEQLSEAYSHYGKTNLKKLISFCDLVITDCIKLSGESVKNKKPRKRKTKTHDQLVAKVKYCEKFDELNLISQKPKDIIGASQIWVYNTKYKKLGCYHANDASGFSVKGTTIVNFNENKSIQKSLRKPKDVLTILINGGKLVLRNLISEIVTVESNLNGRLNDDTVIVRIIK